MFRCWNDISVRANSTNSLSYALDIHDEIREAVFRRTEVLSFDRTLLTAAFVTLTELDYEETLTSQCLESGSPIDFKISFFSGAAHLAKQQSSDRFSPLFSKAAPFVRAQLKVRSLTKL